MSAIVDKFFMTPVWIRATVAVLAAYLLVEIWKPSISFHATEDAYYSKGFKPYQTEEGEIIPGTKVPWWGWLIGAGVLFGLFI